MLLALSWVSADTSAYDLLPLVPVALIMTVILKMKKEMPSLQGPTQGTEVHIKVPQVPLRDFPPPGGVCSSIPNI